MLPMVLVCCSRYGRIGKALPMALLAVLSSMAMAASGWSLVDGSYQTILANRSSELVIWRLAENQEVMVLDFPGMAQQGRTFNRITQLIEQFSEPYKRVLTMDELQKYFEAIRRNDANFAYGHDVLVSELVLFYNLVDRDKVELFPEELALRDFLIEQNLMRVWRGIYQAVKPDQVLISVPQIRERGEREPRITAQARRAVMLHELAHGEYYTNVYYARYCRKYWSDILTDNQREIFSRFLGKYNYNVNRQELLINEMQAYLMFTPDPQSFSAEKLGITETELHLMRKSFRNGRPPTKLPLDNE